MSPPPLRLRRDAVEWRAVEDEVVALDLRDSIYLGANTTAAVLWRLLAEGATRDQLTGALLERFEVDQPRARAAVEDFLAELDRRALLER